MYDFIIAIILGIVEGLTEFLPVSSTGHLILAQQLLGADGPKWNDFSIMIQLGAILAVVVLYFQRLWSVLIRLPSDPAARHFAAVVIVGVIPSLLLGALFGSKIKALLFNPLTVGIMLILGGLVILLVESIVREARYDNVERVPLLTGLGIGLIQVVSMIPGTSRSGATIIGGYLLGLDRKTAAEYSFFLAIPTMLAAFAYEAYKELGAMDWSASGVLAVGFVTSFISALLVIKPFIAFISRRGFAPFAYYRVALGVLVLTIMWL